MARVGIDLGTSNSAAAVFVAKGLKGGASLKDAAPLVTPSEGMNHGMRLYPSYVSYSATGACSAAGLVAKNLFGTTDARVLRYFKRLLGRPFDLVQANIRDGNRFLREYEGKLVRGDHGEILIELGGRRISLVEVTAELLSKIAADADRMARDKCGEAITETVIGVPAEFDDQQRKATLEAAKLANLPKPTLLDEPTAAAVRFGVKEDSARVLVVDIGAGTTDIVAGHMEKHDDSIRLVMASRMSDGNLGGIDMDYLVLEHLFATDETEPRLRDVYESLPDEHRTGILTRIEDAKISAGSHGRAFISTFFPTDRGVKAINAPIEEQQLAEIVRPLLWGTRDREGRIKGVRPLLERMLIETAGFDAGAVVTALNADPRLLDVTSLRDPRALKAAGLSDQEVNGAVERLIVQFDHLVLVGGPLNMKICRQLLREVFAANSKIVGFLERIDRDEGLRNFFSYAVAQGAALSDGARVEVTTQVPYDVSFFHWGNGRTVGIHKGSPYRKEDGVNSTTQVPVDGGANKLYVVTEKVVEKNFNWPMTEHIVRVPAAGNLNVSLDWNDEGGNPSKASVDGAGLPSAIRLPAIEAYTTLGSELSGSMRQYLEGARSLRSRISAAEGQIQRDFLRNILRDNSDVRAAFESQGVDGLRGFLMDGIPLLDRLQQIARERTQVPEADLRKAEAVDVEAGSRLTEAEIDSALRYGYFHMRQQIAEGRAGIPPRAREVLDFTYNMPPPDPPAVQDLLTSGQALLAVSANKGFAQEEARQLRGFIHEIDQSPGNAGVVSAATTSLMALADALYKRNPPAITEAEYQNARYIAYYVQT